MADSKLISVWSAPGSAGRSTVALGIAGQLAHIGKRVFLLDADTYSPSLDVLLSFNDHPAGLAAACRLVSQNRFDSEQLNRLSVKMSCGSGQLAVMTGLSSALRWPEVSVDKLQGLIKVAAQEFEFVILDVAASIEPNLQVFDSACERNAVTRWAVSNSDQILAICSADPGGVARYLDAYVQLDELAKAGKVTTIVNRLRSSVLGGSAKQQITQTLSRMAHIDVAAFIPDDQAGADQALRASLPITLGKRSSPARLALELLTKAELLGERNKLDARLRKRPLAKLV